MRLSPLDICLFLLLTALIYMLVVRLARVSPNSGFNGLVQTRVGKLLIIISLLLLVSVAVFLLIVFTVGC